MEPPEARGRRPGACFPQAIVARAVLRVTTGDECVHVRQEPAVSAESLGCFADGVLLGVFGDGPPPAVPGWLAAKTPGLEPGWVEQEVVVR